MKLKKSKRRTTFTPARRHLLSNREVSNKDRLNAYKKRRQLYQQYDHGITFEIPIFKV